MPTLVVPSWIARGLLIESKRFFRAHVEREFSVVVKSGYFSPPCPKASDKCSAARVERGVEGWRSGGLFKKVLKYKTLINQVLDGRG